MKFSCLSCGASKRKNKKTKDYKIILSNFVLSNTALVNIYYFFVKKCYVFRYKVLHRWLFSQNFTIRKRYTFITYV